MSRDSEEQQQRPESTGFDAKPKGERDRIDLGNEIAGRDVGRNKRFLSPEMRESSAEKEKRKEEQRFSLLMRLLRDREYAQLHTQALAVLDASQAAVNLALSQLHDDYTAATDRLDAIRDSAATLPDGTRVYQSANGKLLTEDGRDVSERTKEAAGLTPASPSWEEYASARDATNALEQEREQIEEYQTTVLDPGRERINDPDNPYSREELEQFIKNAPAAMPARVRENYQDPLGLAADAEVPEPETPAKKYLDTAPDLSASFAVARDMTPAADAPSADMPADAPKPR